MTDNEKYVKRGHALIIGDDPQRHEEVAAANRNKVGAPFRYAESQFAALAVVKSMTGLPYRHLQRLKSANIHEDSKPGNTAAWIAPFINKVFTTMRDWWSVRHMMWVGSTRINEL